MDRKQYFEELHIALTREGFTSQPEQDELLPVEWDGLPLCRITADGGVRYWQEDVATPERERACERATDLACTVREYMTLLEQAPPLQAQSLTGDYRLLADFNGAVLAAHPTRLGVQFVTWGWSFDRTGLNQGNYFQENYVGAKQDFAIRAGLISKQQIFNQEQLVEIYRCCSDTLDAGFDLTAEQEKCIRSVQEQIAIAAPDTLERIREQEQHPMEPYSAGLFSDFSHSDLTVSDTFLRDAGNGDFCFVEDAALAPVEQRIEKLIIFKWNRTYPADRYFDLKPYEGAWHLALSSDFAGSSHERITMEVFER